MLPGEARLQGGGDAQELLLNLWLPGLILSANERSMKRCY